MYGYGSAYLGVVLSKVCPLLFFLLYLPSWVSHFEPTRDYSRESIPPESQKLGIRDEGYIPRLFLYVLFGLLDAMWQTTAYWLIGAMSNSPQRLAHFAGFCKSPPRCTERRLLIVWGELFQINLCSLLVLPEFGEQMEPVSRE